jgi:hypothetical protein
VEFATEEEFYAIREIMDDQQRSAFVRWVYHKPYLIVELNDGSFSAVAKLSPGANKVLKLPKPLSKTLRDPELMYGHIRVGLTLVSGSDMSYMEKQMKKCSVGMNKEDKQVLKNNWALVKARLIEEGWE